MTPEGRCRLFLGSMRVGKSRHVAANAGVARQTWPAKVRWLDEGEDDLMDESSRPYSSPHETDREAESLTAAAGGRAAKAPSIAARPPGRGTGTCTARSVTGLG